MRLFNALFHCPSLLWCAASCANKKALYNVMLWMCCNEVHCIWYVTKLLIGPRYLATLPVVVVRSVDSYLRSFLSFPLHRCTLSSSLITLSRPSLTSRLKIAIRSYFRAAPVLWNNLPSHIRQVVHHVTPLPILKNLSHSLFLSSLVCVFT